MEPIIGHLVGDILFQNRWLALKKREAIWGMCLHSLIVTVFVALFAGWFDWRAILAFLSHFLIDWFRLKELWPKWVGQYESVGPFDDQVFHITLLFLIGRL